MPGDTDEGLSDTQQRRHDLHSALAIICGQTQLLQCQVRRMDGFSNGDRQRLDSGLASILTAARSLETTNDEDLALHQDREAS